MSVSKFPSKRNYSIQRIDSYLDYAVVSVLFSATSADPFPTSIVIITALIIIMYMSRSVDASFKTIEVSDEIDILKNKFKYRTIFKIGPEILNDAYVKTFLFRNYIILPSDVFKKSNSYIRSIIAHERAHVARQDTITTFIYTNMSQYIVWTILMIPVSIIFFGGFSLISKEGVGGMVGILIYYLPAVYLFFNRKRYLFRRELMADADAANYLTEEYRSFIYPAARREQYVRKGDAQKIKTHPTFQERWLYLVGERRESGYRLFVICMTAIIVLGFAIFGFSLNLLYDPENDFTAEFHLVKSIVAVGVFSLVLFNVLRIIRIILEIRINGLTIVDRAFGLLGFIVGGTIIFTLVSLLYGSPASISTGGKLYHPMVIILSGALLYIVYFLCFCVLLMLQSALSTKDHMTFFFPIIWIVGVFNNYAHYIKVPILNPESTNVMIRDSVSWLFVLFAHAIILDILWSGVSLIVKIIRSAFSRVVG